MIERQFTEDTLAALYDVFDPPKRRDEHPVETPVEGDVVRFTVTFTSSSWDRPQVGPAVLLFLDADALAAFLSDAGLAVEEQFGDWTRQPLTHMSPEIITIARKG